MRESHLRSVLKSISWRVFATLTTVLITWFITAELRFALYVGGLEFFSKLFLYYLHERLWAPILIGRTKSLNS